MADDRALINSSSPAQTPSSRPLPFREDCWSEDATSTLVDAWGRRYLELNRGNLRQKDWQEVADFVNARHGHTKKTRRTDVQCKNRIDTLKKKYKVEKARVSESNGQVSSNWPFYSRLDPLIGSAATAKKSSSSSPPISVPLPYRKPPSTALSSQFPQPLSILPQKRPLPVAATVDDSYFRRNYSAVAAAAAAAEEEGSEDDESLGTSDDEGVAGGEGARKDGIGGGETDSMKRLARAIEERFTRELKERNRNRWLNWRNRGCSLLKIWKFRGCSCLWILRFNWRKLSKLKERFLMMMFTVNIVRFSIPEERAYLCI